MKAMDDFPWRPLAPNYLNDFLHLLSIIYCHALEACPCTHTFMSSMTLLKWWRYTIISKSCYMADWGPVSCKQCHREVITKGQAVTSSDNSHHNKHVYDICGQKQEQLCVTKWTRRHVARLTYLDLTKAPNNLSGYILSSVDLILYTMIL